MLVRSLDLIFEKKLMGDFASRFDIRRYCPKVSANAQWVKERSHEAYAKNYSMVFPHDEPLAGRNMKKVQSSWLSLMKVVFSMINIFPGSFTRGVGGCWLCLSSK